MQGIYFATSQSKYYVVPTAQQKLLAAQLSRGIAAERISQHLQTLTTPSKCRAVETRDIEVVTPHFGGGEGNRNFLTDSLTLFIEGEAQAAEVGQPWYNIRRPITVRASYLGGEQIATGILPLTMALPTRDWLIRIDLSATDLNGYARVQLSKCLFD